MTTNEIKELMLFFAQLDLGSLKISQGDFTLELGARKECSCDDDCECGCGCGCDDEDEGEEGGCCGGHGHHCRCHDDESGETSSEA